ncbi:MAG TPA: hypothetical protein VF875_16875 [Anaeromyxobacter sp.]
MADLENGSLVQHKTLGIGKVVALETDAVHVFFPDSDRRFAAKLRLPAARALLRTDGIERNSWLEGLTAFSLDPEMRRFALAASWLTHDEAVEQFLGVFPGGFGGAPYLSGRSARASKWRAGHDAWVEVFGGDRAPSADDPDPKDLAKRALKVEKPIVTLLPAADAGAIKEALSDPETAIPFWSALLELLSVPSPGRARFEKLFAAARGLPVDPAQQWLVATLFPFLASTTRHVLVRPKLTCEAASRLGCDVGEDGEPNWGTYAAVRALYAQLLEKLAPSGAKDFVDVEPFLHVTATAKRRARSAP